MKRALVIASIGLAFAPLLAFAQPLAGFPPGNIWFSKDPFYVGDNINVSTLLFNATSNVLRGSLDLYDGSVIIQEKGVAIDPGGSVVIDFPVQVTRGKHSYHVRIQNNDLIGPDGVPVTLKSGGEYSGETALLTRDPIENPNASSTQAATSSGPVASSNTSAITLNDEQHVADTVEKVLPTKVVEPIVGVAAPVIGATESFRVDQANGANKHVLNTIGDIAKTVGVSAVLGTSTEVKLPHGQKAGMSSSTQPKISAWDIFRAGFSNGNFVKTPFGYVELFFFLAYQWIVSTAWAFYLVIALIIWRLLVFVKRLIFPAGD